MPPISGFLTFALIALAVLTSCGEPGPGEQTQATVIMTTKG